MRLKEMKNRLSAPWTCEVTVQNTSQSNACYVCYRSWANENALPECRVGRLPILEARFAPRMCKVGQKNEAKDKHGGIDEGDVVTPEHKEPVWNKEAYDYQ